MLLGRLAFGDSPTTAMVFAVFKRCASCEESCNDDSVCIGVIVLGTVVTGRGPASSGFSPGQVDTMTTPWTKVKITIIYYPGPAGLSSDTVTA